jgi:DDE family transposase
MSEIVYRISGLLEPMLVSVPKGSNLGLFHLLWALLSGKLLASRGAVSGALWDLGLPKEAVRRSLAALSYGRLRINLLLFAWQQQIQQEGHFRAHRYEGYTPVACDLVGFFRPRLFGCASKHYQSQAGKALPAVVLAIVAPVGSIGAKRVALPRLVVRAEPATPSEAALKQAALKQAHQGLAADEALVVDAGFALADLLGLAGARFVLRLPKNFTARNKRVPTRSGPGRPREYGIIVRPLARRYRGKRLSASPPDGVARWKEGKKSVRAHLYEHLVLKAARPGSAGFRCVVIYHPDYKQPLVLATNLMVSAYALYRLYRDRWPIETVAQAAKQVLGAERAFVFSPESRMRLPELAIVAGSLLSYVAATCQPVATGFWDRAARPTCGRLRRMLSRVDFAELALSEGQLCKKASVTGHLKKGIEAHRRRKGEHLFPKLLRRPAFTGN